jgi:hypothetical protein
VVFRHHFSAQVGGEQSGSHIMDYYRKKEAVVKRFRFVVLIAALMTVGVTGAAASAPVASANSFFSCEACENVSGANETINRVLGETSGTGLCVTIWLDNGGGSYTELAKKCTETGFKNEASYGGTYTAHGDVKRWAPGNPKLTGDQIFE